MLLDRAASTNDTGSLPGKLSFSALSSLASTDRPSGRWRPLGLHFSAATSCSRSLRSACSRAPLSAARAAPWRSSPWPSGRVNLASGVLGLRACELSTGANVLAQRARGERRLHGKCRHLRSGGALDTAREYCPSKTTLETNMKRVLLAVLALYPGGPACRRHVGRGAGPAAQRPVRRS